MFNVQITNIYVLMNICGLDKSIFTPLCCVSSRAVIQPSFRCTLMEEQVNALCYWGESAYVTETGTFKMN